MLTILVSFDFEVDPCHEYKNLSDFRRNSSYQTPAYTEFCDREVNGWRRFVKAAGTKMPTTPVEAFRCGTKHSGWLESSHPTVEDDEVFRQVCFSTRTKSCFFKTRITVKNCSSYYIYKLHKPPQCESRYCGTD